MLLTSLGNYLSVHSVRKDRLKRTIILQLSDFISADCDYGSHGFLLSYEDTSCMSLWTSESTRTLNRHPALVGV